MAESVATRASFLVMLTWRADRSPTQPRSFAKPRRTSPTHAQRLCPSPMHAPCDLLRRAAAQPGPREDAQALAEREAGQRQRAVFGHAQQAGAPGQARVHRRQDDGVHGGCVGGGDRGGGVFVSKAQGSGWVGDGGLAGLEGVGSGARPGP
jgi:hypothetical protein